MRKLLILILVAAVGLAAVGCQKSPETLAPEEPAPAEGDPGQNAALLPVGEITDRDMLQKLWEEYFYHTIATVGNTREFNSATEIEPMNIAEYAWFKYDVEHGRNTLEMEDGTLYSRIFPLETVLEYAERYFNLTELDVTDIPYESQYDPVRKAFLLGLGEENKVIPSYNSGNDWSIKLTSVAKNADGTVTAVLTSYDYQHKERVVYTRTYTLKEREDGSLYFLTGKWEYINNNLVELSGDYQRFDRIAGFDMSEHNIWQLQELKMLGEAGGKVLFYHTPYQDDVKGAFLLLDPDSMKVAKRLELPESIYHNYARMSGDKVILFLNDRLLVADLALEGLQEVPLPKSLAAKIARETKYDQNGMPDIFFGGYDISADMQQIVYADEIGLKLLSLADGSEKLLAETVPILGSDLMNASYHSSPRFVAGEQKVITTMTAYEGTMGYTMCDLTTGEVKKYSVSGEGSSTWSIRYDTGMLEINAYVRDGDTFKSYYLDFHSGELREVAIAEPGDTGYIRFSESVYVGQNYAAFITTRMHEYNDNDQNMSYLNLLDLKTMQTKEQLVAVKAAETYLLGVLSDGRMIFWYVLNASEYGICITE